MWWKVTYRFSGHGPGYPAGSMTFTAKTVGGAMRKFLGGLSPEDRELVGEVTITQKK